MGAFEEYVHKIIIVPKVNEFQASGGSNVAALKVLVSSDVQIWDLIVVLIRS